MNKIPYCINVVFNFYFPSATLRARSAVEGRIFGYVEKQEVRKNFASIQIVDEAIQIFRDCLSGEYFSFDKIKSYVAL